MNRYSQGKDQISNTSTLTFLMKNRSLKSLAASAVSDYVNNRSNFSQDSNSFSYKMNNLVMQTSRMNLGVGGNLGGQSGKNSGHQNGDSDLSLYTYKNTNFEDTKFEYMENLDLVLSDHLKEYLIQHCYTLKDLYQQWRYQKLEKRNSQLNSISTETSTSTSKSQFSSFSRNLTATTCSSMISSTSSTTSSNPVSTATIRQTIRNKSENNSLSSNTIQNMQTNIISNSNSRNNSNISSSSNQIVRINLTEDSSNLFD